MISKNVLILGSTGSIGTRTLDVIRQNPKSFTVAGLSAWSNSDLFKRQIAEFKPKVIFYPHKRLKELLPLSKLIKIFSKSDGLNKLVKFSSANLVVNALSGVRGIATSRIALKSGKHLALANKESLVCAGRDLAALAKVNKVNLIPIDSELTALFQLLRHQHKSNIEKIILTCSGGPFRGMTKAELSKVTKDMALKHPTWKMGAKTTIDSATLVNKGLEVISAMNLFGLKINQIEVVIHPESEIHAFVCFIDGTIIAQMTYRDMRIPISYALHYPKIVSNTFPRLQISSEKRKIWTFHNPDMKTFEGLKYAYKAARLVGDYPKRFCLANEKAVQLFLDGKIKFMEIYTILRDNLK